MAAVRASGTEGYAEEAEALIKQYEGIAFSDLQSQILHLIPTTPGRILDIGSRLSGLANLVAVQHNAPTPGRHHRARPGDPRLSSTPPRRVDGRNKSGDDGFSGNEYSRIPGKLVCVAEPDSHDIGSGTGRDAAAFAAMRHSG
jgi:hypothetical protein